MKTISNLIEAHVFKETLEGIEFLLLKRSANQIYPGVWQMVSGKIIESSSGIEKAYETAIRELKEETGLNPLKVWVAPKVNAFYTASTDTICIVPVFTIQVGEESVVKLSHEHEDYKWVTPDVAKQMLAWDGQRRVVSIIEEYFLNEKAYLNFVEVKLNI